MSFGLLASLVAIVAVVNAQSPLYGQCGGIGWSGATTCSSGVCTVSNAYYSQCLPGTATSSQSKTTVSTGTTVTTSHSTTTTTSSSHSVTTTASSPSGLGNLPRLGGVNFAGFDFGIQTDGSKTNNFVVPPTPQLTHFTNEGVNIFRVPLGWQNIQPTLGGPLNQTTLTPYANIVNTALSLGAYVLIDIHNYARWNGGIVGQGGPTDAQLADLWTKLATQWVGQSKVLFGIMNEPHDLNINTWATTLQTVVNAIRATGATSQTIVLPGNDYTSAATFTTWYSALAVVTDPVAGNGFTKLIFDLHRYLDSDGSGTHSDCTSNRVSDFQADTALLQAHGRQAILSEIGVGTGANCQTYVTQALTYIVSAYPSFVGFTGWGAGAFDSSSITDLSPTPNNAVSATDSPQWTWMKPFIP